MPLFRLFSVSIFSMVDRVLVFAGNKHELCTRITESYNTEVNAGGDSFQSFRETKQVTSFSLL